MRPDYSYINYVYTLHTYYVQYKYYVTLCIYVKLTQVSTLHIHQAYNMWDFKHKVSHNISLLQMDDFTAEFFKRFNCYLMFFLNVLILMATLRN